MVSKNQVKNQKPGATPARSVMLEINLFALSLWSSLSIFCLWGVVFTVAEIWKHSWSWIDDKEKISKNIIFNYLSKFSRYKYPIYKYGRIYSYVKDIRYKDMSWHSVPDGKEGTPGSVVGYIILISSIVPVIVWIVFEIYPVILVGVVFIIIANLARFTRRLSKKYNLHVNDNDIHLKKEGE